MKFFWTAVASTKQVFQNCKRITPATAIWQKRTYEGTSLMLQDELNKRVLSPTDAKCRYFR